jgi:hypothetical protein
MNGGMSRTIASSNPVATSYLLPLSKRDGEDVELPTCDVCSWGVPAVSGSCEASLCRAARSRLILKSPSGAFSVGPNNKLASEA